MSIYNDCFLACALKPDVPQQVIDTLRYMTREASYEFDNPPAHNFFHYEPDWRDFLHDMYDYRVAPGLIASKLERKTHDFVAKPSIDYYEISFRRSLYDDTEFPM